MPSVNLSSGKFSGVIPNSELILRVYVRISSTIIVATISLNRSGPTFSSNNPTKWKISGLVVPALIISKASEIVAFFNTSPNAAPYRDSEKPKLIPFISEKENFLRASL